MGRTLADNHSDRRKMMLEESVYKVIPIIAIPMIISMLIDSVYNIADTYFVSQLGKSATAAVGINDSMLHFIRSVAMGFGMGASSYISRLLGAKQEEHASKVGTTTFFTSIGTLTVLAIIAYIFVEPLVSLLGATESVKPYSMDYARFILISAPFTAGEVALSQLLRAEGSTKFSMFGMVSGCVINIALDPLFISVFGLEVAGAAIATTISKAVSFVVLLIPFLKKRTLLEIRFKYFTPKVEIYKEVARMGIPTFLRSSMMSVATVITNNIAGGFSDSALAATTVASKCTRLVGSAVMGFGQGFQPVAGYCWGAKHYKRVIESFRACMIMGAIASIALGTVLSLFAKDLVSVFADNDAEVIRLGTIIVVSQCITLVFHIGGMVINGLFQALGRALQAGILGLARQVICLIPSVIILSLLFDVEGLALSQAVADVACIIIAGIMYIKLRKELITLATNEKDEPVDFEDDEVPFVESSSEF